MKKALVTLFAITLALGVFAQDSTNKMNNMAPKHDMQSHEGVIMKEGKLLVMKNGQTTQLTRDMTLDNGTIIMAGGTVKTKEGTTTILKEGDFVKWDGTIGNIKTKLPKDYMGKDSMMPHKMKADSVK